MLWNEKIDQLDRSELVELILPLSEITMGAVVRQRTGGASLEVRMNLARVARTSCPDPELRQELRHLLYRRASWNSDSESAEVLQRKVLDEAANGVSVRYAGRSASTVEADVAVKVAEALATQLSASNISETDLAERMRAKLSDEDWAALKRTLGSDTVSAEALRKIAIKAAAGGGGVMAVNAAGFAAYMALSSGMAAVAGAF